MIKQLVIDTDFISDFACINKFDIVTDLYSPNIILIDVVEEEIKDVESYYIQISKCINKDKIERYEMFYCLKSSHEYLYLNQNQGIGKGEAATMAYCKAFSCILASNNFSDILTYCEKHKVEIKTTTDIMIEANKNQLFNSSKGNVLWKKMIKKGRYLPYSSFNKALKQHKPIYY